MHDCPQHVTHSLPAHETSPSSLLREIGKLTPHRKCFTHLKIERHITRGQRGCVGKTWGLQSGFCLRIFFEMQRDGVNRAQAGKDEQKLEYKNSNQRIVIHMQRSLHWFGPTLQCQPLWRLSESLDFRM